MISKRKSLQQVVLDLMETGKKRRLFTRMWSTTPEYICILEEQKCPVHPMVTFKDKVVSLSALVQHLIAQRPICTEVSAFSEEKRHAASTELYSQLVIENHSQEILFLDTSKTCNYTKVEKFFQSKDKNSKNGVLVVVEDCGSLNKEFLQECVFPFNGAALIVSLKEDLVCKITFLKFLAYYGPSLETVNAILLNRRALA
jgi:hypothetical protein